MSDSFLIAARIPISREGFDRWLDGTGAPIADPDRMYAGWYWDGDTPDWSPDPTVTAREFFAGRVADSCDGRSTITVLRHRDGALEAYLFDAGHRPGTVHTALSLLAAAGPPESASLALFWAETAGNLLDADSGAWLAVLAIGPDGGARFVADRDLTATVAGLRPVEEAFFEQAERLAEDEESWDADGDPGTDIPRDPAFVDPAVLA
ncbi:hypothetical protein [Longispora urticae]